MKILGNISATQNANCGRQYSIEGTNPSRRGQSTVRKINVGTLSESMHAGIGASSAVNSNPRARNSMDRPFKFILDRLAMGLALPAGKCGSVIGDGQLESRHP